VILLPCGIVCCLPLSTNKNFNEWTIILLP
jgi:hypothetical protein